LKKRITKISLIILIGLIISCNSTKRVAEGKRLLTSVDINVNDIKNTEEDVYFQLYQKPNSKFLGYRLRLGLFNLAQPKSDSLYHLWLAKKPKTHQFLKKLLSEKQVNRLGKSFVVSGFDNFLMKLGESPVVFDSVSTLKSLKRLQSYYYNKGFFNVKTKFSTDISKDKKVGVKYDIQLGKPFILDTISTEIASPALDSLYKLKATNSFVKNKQQYKTEDFENERTRITNEFRNNGVYAFQPNYITFHLDTIDKGTNVNSKLIIRDQEIRVNDTTKTQPFSIYTISKINVFTDVSNKKNNIFVKDSVLYNGFHIYSENKLKYRPKSLTDAIFISPGSVFSETKTVLTSKYLSNLQVFDYPTINYQIDKKNKNALIANIFLTPRDKYTFQISADFIHSNIQDFGISGNTSLKINNVLNGAETFQIGLRGNVGAAKDLANPNNNFFNISEYGIDAKLNFPRIFFPFKTEKIIPKSMIPTTTLAVGYAKQTNIGLDKQSFTGSFSYNWSPKKNKSFKFSLIDVQFINNVNIGNYYNVYTSSYNTLNEIAVKYNADLSYFNNGKYADGLIINSGIDDCFNDPLVINQVLLNETDIKRVFSVFERKNRLTENNLIVSSSLQYNFNTQKDANDENYFAIKTKVESAGNVLSLFSKVSSEIQNQDAKMLFNVAYSQYIKTEFEHIKHWQIGRKKVIAVRSFFGIAIPYGNSASIPFSRSYFAGGANDIRAWQPYSLGPGASVGFLDFNEANMKFTCNAEYRFPLFSKMYGALFVDAGNIWNVFDNVDDPEYNFSGIKSFESIAIGSGFGLRYDFGLLVFRVDFGLKTYNPSKLDGEKWFKEITLSKTVINFGINYPF
jgi:outer membrane protein assembly factor BamA